MNETRTLAEYAITTQPSAAPAEVLDRTRQLLLDQLGCQIAGVQMPWSKSIYDVVAALSATGTSTVVGRTDRLAPDAAGFVNSAFGHSNESDDTHLKTPTHPGAVIIPAAVSVAEHVAASGQDLLDAIVVGYEVMLRISYAVSPYLIAQGHHPPPAVGPFGVAAAASRLLGLDQEQTVNALAIAGSHAAGLQEYTQTGGSVKRLHCAIPVQAGIRAALFAAAGVTGPPTVLEGERGFCKVFAPQSHVERLVEGLGTRYVLMETAIKSYSCCHLIHAALDGLRGLRTRHEFKAGDVAHIRIATHLPSLVAHVGVIKRPQDVLAAQFSMSFSVAMLLNGYDCWWWDFERVDLQDTALLDLAERVDTVVEDAEGDTFKTGLRVTVSLHDGSQLEVYVPRAIGEPELPLTDDQVRAKFRTLSEPVLGAERVAAVERAVTELADAPTVADLADAIAGR
jgi:2-methylcitrate dehydratase PrpD